MAQFRTRARALDLLGRQQIAGIPTAISELIKNAYDAYADHFEADFLREEHALVLRDDGIGMNRIDFENRWLTLGTESKFSKKTMPPIDVTKKERPITGEKGIGRLAIASIGQQVLIVTKAKFDNSSKIVVAYINWGIFELPGLNIEDVVIPVREFDKMPSITDIVELKSEVINTIQTLVDCRKIDVCDGERIINNIKDFAVDPSDLQMRLPRQCGQIEGGGTHFYIGDVDDSLYADIDGEPGSKEATKIEKVLLGFQNTMTPEHSDPQIKVVFRDHRFNNEKEKTYVDIINEQEFFTPEEFEKADHHIIGTFDKYGQFQGTIKIYGEKVYNHTVNWRDNHYKETSCGPFSIKIAYVQGEQKSTRINSVDWAILRSKVDRIGGLYIYRNNIRVLPYGDNDYDFLDIEKNRSKRFSSGFFSFRRIFGAVEILGIENSNLIEKAGREGFIENKAYREFQSILKNLFNQLVADFFDDGGNTPQSEYYNEKKAEFNRIKEALARQDKKAKIKKAKCIQALDSFFASLDNNSIQHQVSIILENFKSELNSIIYLKDHDEASERLLQYESKYRKTLSDYRKNLLVDFPRGFTVTQNIQQYYDNYCAELKKLDVTLFKKAYDTIDALIVDYTNKLDLEISKRKRLQQSVEQISVEAMAINRKKKTELSKAVSDISTKIKQLTNDLILDLDTQIKEVKLQFGELSTKEAENFDLVLERKRMEDEIESISQRNTVVMEQVIRQLESFYVSKDAGEIVTNDQLSDAMSEELEDLRERVQADVELSQLGLAVGILHHEFGSTIKSIRSSLRDLKAWSDIDSNLSSVYQNIKINFEHLDRYLTVFTPLNRRLYRQKEEIKYIDINNFLLDLFGARLERHRIQLKHTKGFARYHIYGFRSTFYPVFVNIVDNAIYWLSQSDVENKTIRLHSDSDNTFYISNNGPAISVKDKERIFDLRFTRKPGGRGLGLNISKQVLKEEGFDICLDMPHNDSTVTFKIFKEQ